MIRNNTVHDSIIVAVLSKYKYFKQTQWYLSEDKGVDKKANDEKRNSNLTRKNNLNKCCFFLYKMFC